MSIRKSVLNLSLCAVTVVLFACALSFGSAGIPLPRIWDAVCHVVGGSAQPQTPTLTADVFILFTLRLPRALLAFVTGAALAITGACMQGIFQNPMADSHVLGISTGAALGATIAFVLGAGVTVLGFGAVTLTAFVFGTATIFLVYALGQVKGRTSALRLLLSGVAISSLFTALISLLMALARDKAEKVLLWTMGSFSSTTWLQLGYITPVVALFAAFILCNHRNLDMLLQGEEQALTMGVNVKTVRQRLMVCSAVIISAATAAVGLIPFVGLITPHCIRLVLGPRHKNVLWYSVWAGGCFLLLADTLARCIAAPMELPVGALTAFCGAPFFLYLLRRQGKQHG